MNNQISLTPPCKCKTGIHASKLVALTGGPGAGKTAVLEVARKSFCEHIVILPEAASILFGGGFWRRETLPGKKASQRAIFHIQREQERMVEEEKRAAIVLCDRGTLDGLAYWPDTETAFWGDIEKDRQSEILRYTAVIHLRTPAVDQGYNLSNPVRIESASQAFAVDERIFKAWEGHPNRVVIESTNDFLEKAAKAMEAIQKWLPSCCLSHPIRGLEREPGK